MTLKLVHSPPSAARCKLVKHRQRCTEKLPLAQGRCRDPGEVFVGANYNIVSRFTHRSVTSGVTESLLGGGGRPSSGGGGGARGRHRNEGCRIKNQMGGAHDVNGGVHGLPGPP